MTEDVRAPRGGMVEPVAAVVIHDRETGAIFATHHFGVADGAELPDREELERLALETAAGDGCEVARHAVLYVEPKALRRGVAYRVEGEALVEIEAKGLVAGVLGK